MNKLAIHGLDGFVRIYDLKNKRTKLETFRSDKIIGMSFTDADHLIMTQAAGLISHKTNGNIKLQSPELLNKVLKSSLIIPGKTNNIWVTTKDAFLLFNLKQDQELQLIKTIPVNNPANVRKGKNEFYFSSNKQLMEFSDKSASPKNIISIKQPISAISSPILFFNLSSIYCYDGVYRIVIYKDYFTFIK